MMTITSLRAAARASAGDTVLGTALLTAAKAMAADTHRRTEKVIGLFIHIPRFVLFLIAAGLVLPQRMINHLTTSVWHAATKTVR